MSATGSAPLARVSQNLPQGMSLAPMQGRSGLLERAEFTAQELSNETLRDRCNLALNLAHDIATGKRTVEDARRFYAETAMAYMRGERPPYTQALQFPVSRGGTADRDRPAGSGN